MIGGTLGMVAAVLASACELLRSLAAMTVAPGGTYLRCRGAARTGVPVGVGLRLVMPGWR